VNQNTAECGLLLVLPRKSYSNSQIRWYKNFMLFKRKKILLAALIFSAFCIGSFAAYFALSEMNDDRQKHLKIKRLKKRRKVERKKARALEKKLKKNTVPSPFEVSSMDGGRWATDNNDFSDDEISERHAEMMARLEAIGYMTGVTRATAQKGAVIHDVAKIYGRNSIYVSGHASEAVLVDLDGRVLHRWAFSMKDIWPDHKNQLNYIRKFHLFPNGDLLVIFEGVGIAKIDRESNLIWARQNGAHHDLDVLDNGDIYVLARKARIIPSISTSNPVLEAFVVGLKPDGTEFFRLSILKALMESDYSGQLNKADSRLPPGFHRAVRRGDLLHMNTVEYIREDSPDVPWIRKGDIITSSRNICAMMAIDLKGGNITWFHKGLFTGQHEPVFVNGRNILFFDNSNHTKLSRVVEFDAKTLDEVWVYRGVNDSTFFSQCCSTARRLPNGNTLITITDMGKVIEVTHDKEIVWEFVNPERAGDKNEYIASIFDMVRLSEDFPLDWLGKTGDKDSGI